MIRRLLALLREDPYVALLGGIALLAAAVWLAVP